MDETLDLTEQPSRYDHLERMTTRQLLSAIHAEDEQVSHAVAQALPALERLIDTVAFRLQAGGRLFYIGAGTSGRLGVLDASELPPTFGVEPGRVVALIAGGDGALRTAVERAEDDEAGAWRDLQPYRPTAADTLVGIAASGRTPYVRGGLRCARRAGLTTGCIVCNPAGPVTAEADYVVVAPTGPEFITGSTRMKAGTATKQLLNMLSTCVMIRLGRVEGNEMTHLQLNNAKLWRRAERIVLQRRPGLSAAEAHALLERYGTVSEALAHLPQAPDEA